MRAPASLLHAAEQQAAAPAPPPPPEAAGQQPVVSVDSDMVVILASLLCALVCVLGLALVSRCACRRFASLSSSSDPTQQQQQATSPPPPPPRGLKKKAIDALPTVSFTAASPSPAASATPPCPAASECAICLADFAEGEALRVLPRCRHGFHVACVDAWLRTRATCPSCRAGIVATQAPVVVAPAAACGRCGQVLLLPPPAQAQPSAAGDDTFLP